MDEDLDKLKAGDRQAWTGVLRVHMPGLVAFARRMLRDEAAAEDVVQTALANVVANFASFEGRCSVKSWLYRAVRNRAVDVLRRQKRWVIEDVDPADDWFDARGHWTDGPIAWDAETAAHTRQVLTAVEEELQNLSEVQREVLLLRDVQGLTPDEVGRILDISSGAVRVRVHRARRALRVRVDARLGEGAR